jgi:hypothetical protein
MPARDPGPESGRHLTTDEKSRQIPTAQVTSVRRSGRRGIVTSTEALGMKAGYSKAT